MSAAQPDRTPPPSVVLPAKRTSTFTKRAEQVAASIEDEVVAARWPIGASLGSEAELIARHNVSRGVLREAIRIVEHHEVAHMRRGPAGGLVVQAPRTGPATTALIVYLEYVGISAVDLLEARRVLEPLAFGLAAQNRTPADVASLRAGLKHPYARGSYEQVNAYEHCLHRAVSRVGRNVALELFVTVLVELAERVSYGAVRPPPHQVSELQHAHLALVDAIEAQDSAAAAHQTSLRLAAMSDWLATHPQNGPIQVGRPGAGGRPSKRAEILAVELFDDIVAAGWPVGEVLGSEDDLIARYSCGRAALREAVRLLEHHKIAQPRRGPGGGLVVTEPDPAAAITAIALYLEYSGVTGADLSAVRNAIELACLDRLMAQPLTADTRRALIASHALDDTSTNADLVATGNDLHLAIADCSENPILALFLRIVTTLSLRHNAPVLKAQMSMHSGLARRIGAAHSEIVDAIFAGDAALARERLLAHLEATLPLWLL